MSFAAGTLLHVVVVLEFLYFFMYAYFSSWFWPFCLKSMQGSWPANMVVSIAWRSITALWSFAFGILLGGGEIELKFFVISLIVFVVSWGSLWPHPLGHGSYGVPSLSRCVG